MALRRLFVVSRLFAVSALVLAACGGEPPPPPSSPVGRPVELGPDGVPESCPFRVDDLCFDRAEEACAAAGCPAPRCLILESYPARVSCQ